MSGGISVLPLEDCLSALIDYRGKTPRKTHSGIPLITAKVVKAGRIETPDEFIAEEDYEAWMTRGYPTVLPPDSIAAAFDQQVQAAAETIISNIHQSRSLAQLRDTLLPKLISGELSVAKIKNQVTL